MASGPNELNPESSNGNAASDTTIWFGTITWVKHGREPRFDSLVRLQEELNLYDAGLGKLVEKHTSYLGFSLESLKGRVTWLQKRRVLDDESIV
jgi:hypothetical protein